MSVYISAGLPLGNSLTAGGFLDTVAAIRSKYPQVTCRTYNNGYMNSTLTTLKLLPMGTKIILIGYSWGADNCSIIASRIGRTVDMIYALQPSVYYPTTPIGSNVLEATCVYNPNWFETFGLGFERFKLASGNTKTKFSLVTTSDSHPGVQYDLKYRQQILDGVGRVVNPTGV